MLWTWFLCLMDGQSSVPEDKQREKTLHEQKNRNFDCVDVRCGTTMQVLDCGHGINCDS